MDYKMSASGVLIPLIQLPELLHGYTRLSLDRWSGYIAKVLREVGKMVFYLGFPCLYCSKRGPGLIVQSAITTLSAIRLTVSWDLT